MPRILKTISEKRIDKRRNRRSGREYDEAAEQHPHQNDWQQPIFLAHFEKLPNLHQETHAALSELSFHRALPGAGRVADHPVTGSVRPSPQPKQISSREVQEESGGEKRR